MPHIHEQVHRAAPAPSRNGLHRRWAHALAAALEPQLAELREAEALEVGQAAHQVRVGVQHQRERVQPLALGQLLQQRVTVVARPEAHAVQHRERALVQRAPGLNIKAQPLQPRQAVEVPADDGVGGIELNECGQVHQYVAEGAVHVVQVENGQSGPVGPVYGLQRQRHRQRLLAFTCPPRRRRREAQRAHMRPVCQHEIPADALMLALERPAIGGQTQAARLAAPCLDPLRVWKAKAPAKVDVLRPRARRPGQFCGKFAGGAGHHVLAHAQARKAQHQQRSGQRGERRFEAPARRAQGG